MTDIEINIAIAKALGIKVVSDGISHNLMPCDFGGAYNPDGISLTFIPNFCKDLNAMHEAEKVLTSLQQNDYCFTLMDIQNSGGGFARLHATADQRAEAFLRTLNLWKEFLKQAKENGHV